MTESTTTDPARLVFVRDFGPEDGFASSEIETLNDEIVIRELVQNALDAKPEDEAGPVRVEFVSLPLPVDRLPGIDDYRNAFGSIPQHLREGTQAKRIDQRISGALDRARVVCLICRDNGTGLTTNGYKKMLNKGAGGKTQSGSRKRGSVGVGHLTAIAASRLRYVLYGSVRADGSRMLGGQCFLATHEDASGVDEHGKPVHRSHHGCLTAQRHAVTFTGIDPHPADHPPDWLVEGMGRGTAVCITAHETSSGSPSGKTHGDDLGALIAATIAHHFTVAIADGLMEVTHRDTTTGTFTQIDGKSDAGGEGFRAALERIREKKRAPRNAADLGAGINAYAAWKTWSEGEPLPPQHASLRGARIKWRETPGERTRVTVFREGMRISDRVRGLEAPDFADRVAFNAVIDATGPFGSLVRECETGSHLQIDPRQAAQQEGVELRQALKALREALREAVPTKDTKTWEPEATRLLRGELDDRSPRQRAKPAPPPIEEDPQGVDEGRPQDDDPNPQDGDHPGDTNRSRVQRVTPGRLTGLAASVIPRPDGRVRVIWQTNLDLGDSRIKALSTLDAAVTISLLAGNGSDPACDKQIKPAALPSRLADGNDDYATSVVLPARQGTVELEIDTANVTPDALDALRVEVAVLEPVEASP